jgi:glycosyltransferase involved in cell wall biosynthesis
METISRNIPAILHDMQKGLVVDTDRTFSPGSAFKEKTTLSVTIGIPAYLAERNIRNLLEALIMQNEDTLKIEEIIIYYDASGDNTLEKAREIKDKKIKVIDGKVRKGFANGVKILLSMNKSDILLLLNDDIEIADRDFIHKIVQPFLMEENIGLVCGNPQPLKPKTFIDKALASRLQAQIDLSYHINHGSNIFSCEGKTLTLSKAFIRKLTLPEDNKELGNVDAYLYFACITSGMKYRFVRDAIVYYRNPTTWNDHAKWISRNRAQKYMMQRKFGKAMADKEYTKPKLLMLCATFPQFIRNPAGCLFIAFTELFLDFKARVLVKNLSETWDVVKTTKNLT